MFLFAGRTGRCQQAGTAYTFFTANNQRQAKDLISVLEEAGQSVIPQLQELAQNARNMQTARSRWNQRNKVNNKVFSENVYRNVSSYLLTFRKFEHIRFSNLGCKLQDNSSPGSNNSSKMNNWQNKPNTFGRNEFYNSKPQNGVNKNSNRDSFPRNPRYNNGNFNQYANSQFQGYQQSYSPPMYGTGQMNGQGKRV